MRERLWPRLCCLLLLLAALTSVCAQSPSDAAALARLRDQLASPHGVTDADAVAIIDERVLAATAAQLSDLEIKLTNGALLHVTSVALELRDAAALVRLGVEARPTPSATAVKLLVTGYLGSGEVSGSRLRMPFRLTDVALDGAQPSIFGSLLREWLLPARWNGALPPLELPLQLSQELEIPAARFEVNGQLPMEITTPAYRVKADFIPTAVLILDGRMVVALNLPSHASAPSPTGNSTAVMDEATLKSEIKRLGSAFTVEGSGVRLRLRRAALNALLGQVAAAQSTDLTLRFKPARIRTEEMDGIFRTINYTDIESGDGHADVRGLSVERIAQGRVDLRLNAQGEMNVRVRGREYGLPYSLAPRGTFAVNDEIVPLELDNVNERAVLNAAPGSRVPLSVRVGIEIVGHPISVARTVQAPADQWLRNIALPTFFNHEARLPRHLEANGGAQVTDSRTVHVTLSKLSVKTNDDVLEIRAEASISQ